MKKLIITAIEATRVDPGALRKDQKHMKLSEEVGELAKAMLAQEGLVHIKPDMEEPIFEAADCFLMLIDILSAVYPKQSAEEIYCMLDNALKKKYKKWEVYMEEHKHHESAPEWKIHNS